MQGIKKYIILLFAGSVLFWALFVYMGYQAFHQESDRNNENVFLVPPGQGLIRTARLLEEEGLISNQELFKIGVMILGEERNLKAGEFLVPQKSSMRNIMDILVKGEVIQHSLTIVEGWTSYQIVEYLNELYTLSDPIEALPAEGSILPETYNYTYGTSRLDLLSRMQESQTQLVEELWDKRAPDLPFQTIEEAIILASIVERETGLPEERAHVAGVFINRMRRGIRMQSDPTIIYGIDQRGFLDSGLRRSEIDDKDNSYNTYQIDGLQTTPIAHPGRAAIAAVLNPMQTDDLYFVADGTGGHVFAPTLAEHQRNVANWRRIELERK